MLDQIEIELYDDELYITYLDVIICRVERVRSDDYDDVICEIKNKLKDERYFNFEDRLAIEIDYESRLQEFFNNSITN